MKNNESNDYYETSDIRLAAFLFTTLYAILVDIGRNDHNKKTYIFNPGPPRYAILGFYDGSEKVSAKRLIEAYEKLKVATGVFKSNGG